MIKYLKQFSYIFLALVFFSCKKESTEQKTDYSLLTKYDWRYEIDDPNALITTWRNDIKSVKTVYTCSFEKDDFLAKKEVFFVPVTGTIGSMAATTYIKGSFLFDSQQHEITIKVKKKNDMLNTYDVDDTHIIKVSVLNEQNLSFENFNHFDLASNMVTQYTSVTKK